MMGLIEDIELSKIKLSSRTLRVEAGDVRSLAESISRNGLLQPIVVRVIDNYFEIVAGNRRFLAYKHLSRKKITCHIIDLSDKEAYELSLVENIQRRSMNPIEEGQAYIRYIKDYGWGGLSELAKVIGKSQEYVSKRIKLLELPEDLQNEIIRYRIKVSIGEELAYVKDKKTQSGLAKLVSKRRVTVKQLRHKISLAASPEVLTDNWLVSGSLLQQRAITSSQIDSLLREKRKYSKLACTRRPLLVC
jgi:ParB family chromosome partitioning protein